MAKKAVDIKYTHEDRNDNKKRFYPFGGNKLLMDQEVFDFCAENGHSITYVDARTPDVYGTAYCNKPGDGDSGDGESKKPNW